MTPHMPLSLAALLTVATGLVVGVTKLLQILSTTPGERFETTSEAVAEQFLVSFGVAKAFGNVAAGALADTAGRRVTMLAGWVVGTLFAISILVSTSWTAVVACDLLLGLNQALCWSAALFMAHDVLPLRRGLASGLIETSGYAAIALVSPVVDALGPNAFEPLHWALLGLCLGCALLTTLTVPETIIRGGDGSSSSSSSGGGNSGDSGDGGGDGGSNGGSDSDKGGDGGGHIGNGGRDGAGAAAPVAPEYWSSAHTHSSEKEIVERPGSAQQTGQALWAAWAHASWQDRNLAACCLVGLCLNLSTAYAWGAMSRWLARAAGRAGEGASVGSVLLLYSIPKGVLQAPAGHLADRRACGFGPKEFVLLGLLLNAATLACFAALGAATDHAGVSARGSLTSVAAPLAALLGTSTACAYSPIMACVASRSLPRWRASALGAYRFWRDLGCVCRHAHSATPQPQCPSCPPVMRWPLDPMRGPLHDADAGTPSGQSFSASPPTRQAPCGWRPCLRRSASSSPPSSLLAPSHTEMAPPPTRTCTAIMSREALGDWLQRAGSLRKTRRASSSLPITTSVPSGSNRHDRRRSSLPSP